MNSIDYLLKPIGKEDIERALAKLGNLQHTAAPDDCEPRHNPHQAEELLQLFHSLKKQENYKTHFLIPMKGDKLLPVSVDIIQLFYIKDIDLWFNSRLSINVRYSGIKEKILVSKARVAEFKEWFSKKQ